MQTAKKVQKLGGWRNPDILAKYYGAPLECRKCAVVMTVVSVRTAKGWRTWKCSGCGARRRMKLGGVS